MWCWIIKLVICKTVVEKKCDYSLLDKTENEKNEWEILDKNISVDGKFYYHFLVASPSEKADFCF